MDSASKNEVARLADERMRAAYFQHLGKSEFGDLVSLSHAASEDYLEYVRRLVEAVENGSTGVSDER